MASNKLKLDVDKKLNEEDGEICDNNEGNQGDESPVIVTTTNSNFPNHPAIHICCYRSRHVMLCGRSNSIGK